jgi:16S rRNA (uracil1498-N3)-methyltransferase
MIALAFQRSPMLAFCCDGGQDEARPVSSVGVLVGPEGDFSPAEMEAIRAAGAVSVSLGDSVLRSETAAIYALSVLRYELLQP